MIQIPLETFSYNNQSDSTALAGSSVRCSKWNRDSEYLKFTKYVSTECRTVFEAFRHGAVISSGGLCLGWRANHRAPYQWATYEDVIKRARNFGSGETEGWMGALSIFCHSRSHINGIVSRESQYGWYLLQELP